MLALRRRWVGVPFARHGRSTAGTDCWNLVMETARLFGLSLPDYQFRWGEHAALISENTPHFSEPIKRSQLLPGDVVGMDTHGDGQLWHLAPYLGGGAMLNATPLGVEISHLDEQPWCNTLIGFYRLKGTPE